MYINLIHKWHRIAIFQVTLQTSHMFRNYWKIAVRTMVRNKINSLINISGLAIGITCVIFIILYVQDEMRYDRGFKNVESIYQVNLEGNFGGQVFNRSFTPPPVGIALHKEFPEVSDYTRATRLNHEIITLGDAGASSGQGTAGAGQGGAFSGQGGGSGVTNSFKEKNLWAVDSNFLQVFNFPMLEGERNYPEQE